MILNFESPINPTSLGQTGFNLFKSFQNKGVGVRLLPKGAVSIEPFGNKQEDGSAISLALSEGEKSFCRKDKSLSLWHIAGAENLIGDVKNLFTFHETSELTPYEINRLSNVDKVFVSSRYTKEIFDFYLNGTEVVYCPLAFDSESFYRIEKNSTDVITFGIRGKMEKRKHTARIIAAWVKVFGGHPKYRLDCSIFNPFIDPVEQQEELVNSLPDRVIPWNVNILPFMPTNDLYNQALNNADVDLTGMSGGEGFNLPLFQSLCLGKNAIVLNAHAHKDFCDDSNSILVEPSGRIPAEDGKFFIKGNKVNQGQWFDFKESDLMDAIEHAAKNAKKRNINGEKLKSWTFDETAQSLLNNL